MPVAQQNLDFCTKVAGTTHLFLCLCSAPSTEALLTVVFDAAMLNLRFRFLVLLHDILIPAQKWHAKHTYFFARLQRHPHFALHKQTGTICTTTTPPLPPAPPPPQKLQ